MNGLSVFFVIFAYAAILIFIVGILGNVWKYATTPAPLKIPLNPSPVTDAGVVRRMSADVLLFKSLFRSNKLIWLGGYVFHIGLLLVLIKHYRFLFSLQPHIITYLDTYEMYAGFIMLGGLAYLFMMRLVVDRTRYITVMSDYGILLLLMAIGATGVYQRYVTHIDIPGIKQFFSGLVSFNPQPLPVGKTILVHLSLVFLLLIYFPFSKLMHSIGVFFSPTRNQVDNPRDLKEPWRAPWAEGVTVTPEVFSADEGETAQAQAN